MPVKERLKKNKNEGKDQIGIHIAIVGLRSRKCRIVVENVPCFLSCFGMIIPPMQKIN